MVFIDVTGACKSPKNTGMQRTTRNIFRHLAERTPTTPISWNLVGNRYQLLGRREHDILERPFQILGRSTARPEIRGEHFFAELHRQFFRTAVSLGGKLGAGDVLLVPDIYRDGRLKKLPRLLAKTRAKVVAIFHDAAALRLPQLYPRAGPHFHAYIESLAAFDLVICVSNDSRNELLRLWSESKTALTETVVEPWPVELGSETPDFSSERSSNLIVCVGSFEPRKNHLMLLRAAEQLWKAGVNFELELIGRSTGYFGSKVISEVQRLERAGRTVHWSKHVNDQLLQRAYAECRFTVYPSLMEGFGLPIAESLWHGKPVICGGNGALGEIASGGCLIVDQTSEASLADGIKRLVTDETLYARLRKEARARKFPSWSDYIDDLLCLLRVESAAITTQAQTLRN
jgi:glycosyltransferase involved in cell wall biosynthesis